LEEGVGRVLKKLILEEEKQFIIKEKVRDHTGERIVPYPDIHVREMHFIKKF
jgi:hypothetical protein